MMAVLAKMNLIRFDVKSFPPKTLLYPDGVTVPSPATSPVALGESNDLSAPPIGGPEPGMVRRLHSVCTIAEAWGTFLNPTWSLEDLYRTILRHWRTVVVVVIISVVGSVGAFVIVPERYEAQAVLTVEPIAAVQTEDSGTPINMETERVVATSTEVLAVASEALDGTSIPTLQESVEVTVPRDSQVLTFIFTAADAQFAADGANAVANSYSEQRVANAQRVVMEATDNLSDRINELLNELDDLPEQNVNRQNLQLQVTVLQERLATLASATFSSGSLVSPATAPSNSTKPSIAVFIAAGLFLGVLVGMFAALIRGRSRAPQPSTAPSHVGKAMDDTSASGDAGEVAPGRPTQDSTPPSRDWTPPNATGRKLRVPKPVTAREFTAGRSADD